MADTAQSGTLRRDFDGLCALVTGGSSGIGLATATLLSQRGARVAVLDLVPPPADAGPLFYAQGDVSSDPTVRAAVASAVESLGGLDILVNNAGIGAQGRAEDNSDEEWTRCFDINVIGMVRVTRAAIDHLRRSEHAAIVNTSSIVATTGLVRRALYGTTKGAVAALTLAMAADYISEGIRVNCVNPGTVDTPWVARLLAQAPDPQAERAALIARQPHGRLVTPEEVADAIAFLASPSAGSITAVALAVDGGTAHMRLVGGPQK
jgi:2-keto-3-deoxy-L-fuconate dehydrogenase